MTQRSPRFFPRLVYVTLSLLAGALPVSAAFSQTLPSIRTVFVPRSAPPGQPSPCMEFACFNRASYDANTLAAAGIEVQGIYIYRRLPSGPWYADKLFQNRTPLPAGYERAGYRHPLVVVGDDVIATAYLRGPGVPEKCSTHVFGREGTVWRVKQTIDVCASNFARDGNRVLFGLSTHLPVYVRGSDGLYTEESRVLPPREDFFAHETTLALNNWTIVVGRPGENAETGAAYIFQRRGEQWQLLKTLRPDGAGARTRFGHAVSAYEYNIAIGAPGAVNPSGIGHGLVYLYTGVGDQWSLTQQIAEPPGTDSNFGTALALRGRRLVISSTNPYPFFQGPTGYYFERGRLDSEWFARGTLAGHGRGIDLSGSTTMVESAGLRGGTYPAVINLPALEEPDVAP